MPRSTEHDVLIAAAHAVELKPLREALAGETVQRGGLRVATHAIGVGIAVAGAGMANAIAAHPCRAVVLVGSFGVYPGAAARIGDLLAPDEAALIDEAVLDGRAAAPAAMPTRARAHAALCEGLRSSAPGILRGCVATTLSISTDDALANALARSGCVGENLEAVAAGLACEQQQLPWAALLACTNEVGSRGRGQWLAAHAHAAELTAGTLLRWLDSGTPGLP